MIGSTLLWLDDRRDPHDFVAEGGYGFCLWSKTASQAINALETMEFDVVSLDHDLGLVGPNGENPGDGYDVILWIENAVRTKGWQPPEIQVHTDNPPARKRMEQAIQAILAT